MVEGGGKRVVARLALFAALLLAVGVVFAVVEVQVSLRWSGSAGGASGSPVSLSSNDAKDETIKNKGSGVDQGGGSNAFRDEVDLEPPDAPWTGGGKRAYAVRQREALDGFRVRCCGINTHLQSVGTPCTKCFSFFGFSFVLYLRRVALLFGLTLQNDVVNVHSTIHVLADVLQLLFSFERGR